MCLALAEAARRWRKQLQSVMDAPTAGEGVGRACRALARELSGSAYAIGSPLATTTLERAATNDAIRAVCAEHFHRWEEFLVERMLGDHIPPERAARLARFTLASVEGSLILCRAYGSPDPLLSAGDLLRDLIDTPSKGSSCAS
jgi:TetR/AcrR family transcriptional repressor of lmrAB and yxaGH operons